MNRPDAACGMFVATSKGELMKNAVLSILFFFVLGQSAIAQIALDGPEIVCPGEVTRYQVAAPFECLETSVFTWDIQGAESYTPIVDGVGVDVIWAYDASTKKVAVTVAPDPSMMHCFAGIISKYVELIEPVPDPMSLNATSLKLCVGANITLEASMPSDPNSDGIDYNNIVYLWYYSKDGGPMANLPQTSVPTTSFELPSFSSGGDIVFFVRVRNATCPIIQGSLVASAPETVLPPAPSAPDFKLCMDESSGTLILTSVPGGSAGEEYTLAIDEVGNFERVRAGDIIKTIPGYASSPYTFYRYAERPGGGNEGCGVTGTTPTANAYGLAVSAAPNCTGGITASATGGVGSYLFSLDGGAYQSDAAFHDRTPGTHVVKVKDAHGCVGDNSATAFPRVSATVTPKLACPGDDNGSIAIHASGGAGPFHYSVDGGTTLEASNVFSALTADTYTVHVIDDNGAGCTHTQSYTLSNSPAIDITSVLPVKPDCHGEASGSISVTATQGTQPFEYTIGSTYQPESVFSDLLAGSYTVTVRDDNDCVKSSAPIEVEDPLAITFSTLSATPRSCEEMTDGAISVLATGGTAPRRYSIDGQSFVDEMNPATTFTGLSSGVYTISVEDSNGCTAMASSPFVGVKPAIDGTIAVADPISCYGANDGVLKTTPSGGTGPYTLAWSNGVASGTNANLGPGEYSVVITDAKGCRKTFAETLIEPSLLAAQTIISNVACFGGSDGSIDLTPRGGTAPFSYAWSNGASSQDISGLPRSGYEVVIEDAHQCSITLTGLTITEPPPLKMDSTRVKNITCNPIPDGEIRLYPGGGAGVFEYSLDAVTWQTENLFDALSAGNYTAYVRDGNECTLTQSLSLTQPPVLGLSIAGQEDTSCGQANGVATVQAFGGVGTYRYEWYNASAMLISTDAQAVSLRSGDYHARVYDGNQCVSEVLVTINDSDGPVVENVSVTGLTCYESNDGAISVSVAGAQEPYTITWDTQAAGVTAISNVTAGEHWIEILDANDCRTKEVFFVGSPEPIEVDVNATAPSCYGSADGQIQALASGGNAGGYEYTWASGQTTPSISNIPAGTYHLTVRDSMFCAAQEEITLDKPPLFEIDAGGDRTICVGQVVTINAPVDNATYQWTSDEGFSSSDRLVQLSEPATYSLLVINENGCSASDSFVLDTSTELLQADFLSADEAFAGDTIVLVEISWPIPENISWNFPPEATIVSQQDAYAEIVFADAGTYQLALNTFLGECIDEYAKQITIHGERPDAGGRKTDRLIQTFEVHPNPSDGTFTVDIEVSEIIPGRLMLVSSFGNADLFSVPLDNKTKMTYDVALDDPSSGLYFLILETGKQRTIKRIIIR